MTFDDPQRPECNNLLSLYMLLAAKSKQEVARVPGYGLGAIQAVADRNSDRGSKPIQEKYQAVMDNKGYLSRCYAMEKAEAIANDTLGKVKVRWVIRYPCSILDFRF